LSQVVLDIVAVCIALQVVVLTKVRNVVALYGVIQNHLFSYLNLDCSLVVLGHCKDFLDQHEGWFHYLVMVQVFLSSG
jgi:hypothetical protein